MTEIRAATMLPGPARDDAARALGPTLTGNSAPPNDSQPRQSPDPSAGTGDPGSCLRGYREAITAP